ncbi:MAG: hypothetical protein WBQ85_06400 [Candidatus Sulfotelmatobacter sp.]
MTNLQMMSVQIPSELISEAGAPSANPEPTADDRARSALTLVRDLEASLHASRNALLALDLAGIERETREQVRSIRKLEDVLARSMAPRARGMTKERALVRSGNSPEPEPEPQPEPQEELRRSCHRVLEAARLQAALLARARTKLRVMANMLAGQSVNYGPLVAGNGVPSRARVRNSNWNSDLSSGGGI